MSVTLKDVAQAARVSISTASRALTGTGLTSERTRQRLRLTFNRVRWVLSIERVIDDLETREDVLEQTPKVGCVRLAIRLPQCKQKALAFR